LVRDGGELVARAGQLRGGGSLRETERRFVTVQAVRERGLGVLDQPLDLDVLRVVADPERALPNAVGDGGEIRPPSRRERAGDRRPGQEEAGLEVHVGLTEVAE